MEFGAEFFVLVAFVVFLCVLGYLGAHRLLLNALDARGQAIVDELAEAVKLRAEAMALLESFERKASEAEASAAQLLADARAQAERLTQETAKRMEELVARRAKQAEAKIALAEAQAAADVRAAAADCAAKAAATVLRGETQGGLGAELTAREIAALKKRLS